VTFPDVEVALCLRFCYRYSMFIFLQLMNWEEREKWKEGVTD